MMTCFRFQLYSSDESMEHRIKVIKRKSSKSSPSSNANPSPSLEVTKFQTTVDWLSNLFEDVGMERI